MIFLIFLGVVFILIGCSALTIYIIFEKFPQFTEKTGATLRERKHKKDAFIWLLGEHIDHLVKAVYTYKVGEKYYVKRYTYFFYTFNQTPKSIPVVYIKKFPRISYANTFDSTTVLKYFIAGVLNIFWGILILGIVILGAFI